MMNKETIRLNMETYELPKKQSRPTIADISQRDKIARLYALAEKLHVKIGGTINDRA